jgi:hypothetical protein
LLPDLRLLHLPAAERHLLDRHLHPEQRVPLHLRLIAIP